ncbi:MAG: uroporphyrinogen decarboxylase family protein, partial [Polyangiales bacterium]
MNDVFLRACRGEAVPFTPIWLMRQAGRYQASYRALRAKVDFLTLCRTPELATEVTVAAVDELGVDAAIIFADILLILEPLGVAFSFEKGEGPKIHVPLRTTAQVDALAEGIDVTASLGYVLEALGQTRQALAGKVPLIGFAGAPFTLAAYAIEGGGAKHYTETKAFMYQDAPRWHALMAKLTDATITYLQAQVGAGAQALQVFDSWVGCLGPDDYRERLEVAGGQGDAP